jgi:hypothetical protein
MLPEFLEYGFMQRAFAVGIVTALICPAIGVFLIPRRLSLIADTLATWRWPGWPRPFLGLSPSWGLVITVGGAIDRAPAGAGAAGDASLAVFSPGFAVAVVLIISAANADLRILRQHRRSAHQWPWCGLGDGAAVRLLRPLAITLNAICPHVGHSGGRAEPHADVLTALTTVVMRMVGVLS